MQPNFWNEDEENSDSDEDANKVLGENISYGKSKNPESLCYDTKKINWIMLS